MAYFLITLLLLPAFLLLGILGLRWWRRRRLLQLAFAGEQACRYMSLTGGLAISTTGPLAFAMPSLLTSCPPFLAPVQDWSVHWLEFGQACKPIRCCFYARVQLETGTPPYVIYLGPERKARSFAGDLARICGKGPELW